MDLENVNKYAEMESLLIQPVTIWIAYLAMDVRASVKFRIIINVTGTTIVAIVGMIWILSHGLYSQLWDRI